MANFFPLLGVLRPFQEKEADKLSSQSIIEQRSIINPCLRKLLRPPEAFSSWTLLILDQEVCR